MSAILLTEADLLEAVTLLLVKRGQGRPGGFKPRWGCEVRRDGVLVNVELTLFPSESVPDKPKPEGAPW